MPQNEPFAPVRIVLPHLRRLVARPVLVPEERPIELGEPPRICGVEDDLEQRRRGLVAFHGASYRSVRMPTPRRRDYVKSGESALARRPASHPKQLAPWHPGSAAKDARKRRTYVL